MALPILYQDQSLIFVNKPSGLLVHRSAIDRQATEFAMQTVRDQIGQHVYPVHRLDRATSGVLVFALSTQTARTLSEAFANGEVGKTYLAVVRGVPEGEVDVDYPLKEELDRKTDALADPHKAAQPAQTYFKRLATHEFPVQVDKFPSSRYSLVQAQPKTGRKHQIRRHLRHLGHPIIGDVTYGVGKHNRFFETTFKVRRLLLACTEICLRHPVLGTELRVQAPLAEDFSRVIEEIGWGQFVYA